LGIYDICTLLTYLTNYLEYVNILIQEKKFVKDGVRILESRPSLSLKDGVLNHFF
jgi:hypothetical protein